MTKLVVEFTAEQLAALAEVFVDFNVDDYAGIALPLSQAIEAVEAVHYAQEAREYSAAQEAAPPDATG